MSIDHSVQILSDRFKARNISRLVYFHCDHFEPWANSAEVRPSDPRHAEHLIVFANDLNKIDYARRLTLFYKSQLNVVFDQNRKLIRADDDDLVGFVPRSEREIDLSKAGMGYLVGNSMHELQVHIHHEGFTCNTHHKRPELINFFKSDVGRRFDAHRLRVAIELSKNAILEDTGLQLDSWFFVHGNWALNGSDGTICTIANEIEILMEEGCKGDFTFPAGREHVNPHIKEPYFCRPVAAPRAYDLAEAAPESAYGNDVAASAKFFIWSSQINHKRSSLDYHAPWVREALEKPEDWARDIIDQSYVADGIMFFKTHAHSMSLLYRSEGRPIFPHTYPPVQRLLSLVFDAAAAANVGIEFSTASRVYDLFLRSRAPVRSLGSEIKTACHQEEDGRRRIAV